jgi:Flp pilus assembly CpaF family ATPase
MEPTMRGEHATAANVRRGLLAELTRLAADAVADQRVTDVHALIPGEVDERQVVRSVVRRHLGQVTADSWETGDRPLTPDEEQAVLDATLDSVLGLGRVQRLLDDPDITDIHVRGCEPVWVKRRCGSRVSLPAVVDHDDELVDLVRHIGSRLVAGERRFDAAHPELNAQLPDGSRVFATMDISARPSMVIRRHRFELSDLTELAHRHMMSPELAQFLGAVVRARRNVIIAGGTGSGKTTLLRALLNQVPAHERIVTIEDAYELGLDRFSHLHPDHDMLQARPANIEGQGAISLLDLTRMALRMDPDRVVVGEVRGAEAFALVMAMSQGNDGSMATIHADSSRSALPKLAAYTALAGTGLPTDTVNHLLVGAVHFVVHVERHRTGRRITSVREVTGADGSQIATNEVWSSGPIGDAVPAYPLRQATAELLADNGYDPGSPT